MSVALEDIWVMDEDFVSLLCDVAATKAEDEETSSILMDEEDNLRDDLLWLVVALSSDALDKYLS